MQRVARMRDGLPLPVQVLQDADPQLLQAYHTCFGQQLQIITRIEFVDCDVNE